MTKRLFPIRLKETRKNMKFTILELSKLSGVSKSAISDYELGKAIPSIESAVELANVLDVRLSYLIGEEINHYEIMEYVNKILRKHNINAPFLNTENMTTDDLQRFEDDIVLALKIVVEKWRGR